VDEYALSREKMVQIVMEQGQKISALETAGAMTKDMVVDLCTKFNTLFRGYIPGWVGLLMTAMGTAIGFLGAHFHP
jgi:hypothetical protein